jgi:hypothetical protein
VRITAILKILSAMLRVALPPIIATDYSDLLLASTDMEQEDDMDAKFA